MFFRAVRKPVALLTSISMLFSNLLYADSGQIVVDGRTATTVVEVGNRTDVCTATVSGDSAFNSFGKFDVYSGNTVNLYLPDGTSNLINMVMDERTDVDGILNSYKDGRIGGNVYFLNPHGIVVGAGGVVNVGALNLVTPTAEFMDEILRFDGSVNPSALNLILAGNVPLDPSGLISVNGRVNAMDSIDLAAGDIDIAGVLRAAKARVPGIDYDVPVNMADIQADGVVTEGGRIRIVAANDVTIREGAELSVSSARAGNAGSVNVWADNNATLDDGAAIRAAGGTAWGNDGTIRFKAAGDVDMLGETEGVLDVDYFTIHIFGDYVVDTDTVIDSDDVDGCAFVIFDIDGEIYISDGVTLTIMKNVTFRNIRLLGIDEVSVEGLYIGDGASLFGFGNIEIFAEDVELGINAGITSRYGSVTLRDLNFLGTGSDKMDSLILGRGALISGRDGVFAKALDITAGESAQILSAMGNIELEGREIVIGKNVRVNASGDVKIKARDSFNTDNLSTLTELVPAAFKEKDMQASVRIDDGARIEGANVEITAKADASKLFDLVMAEITGDEDSEALANDIYGKASGFIGLDLDLASSWSAFFVWAKTHAKAEINIGKNVTITSPGDITMKAEALAVMAIQNIGIFGNFVIAQNIASALLSIGDGTVIEADGDLTVNATATNESQVRETGIPAELAVVVQPPEAPVDIAFTYNITDTESRVTIGDAVLSGDESVAVSADAVNELSTEISSGAGGNKARASVSVAYVSNTSDAVIESTGTLRSTRGSVDVHAASKMDNTLDVEAVSGTQLPDADSIMSVVEFLQARKERSKVEKLDMGMSVGIQNVVNNAKTSVKNIQARDTVDVTSEALLKYAASGTGAAGDEVPGRGSAGTGAKIAIGGSVLYSKVDNTAFTEVADDGTVSGVTAAGVDYVPSVNVVADAVVTMSDSGDSIYDLLTDDTPDLIDQEVEMAENRDVDVWKEFVFDEDEDDLDSALGELEGFDDTNNERSFEAAADDLAEVLGSALLSFTDTITSQLPGITEEVPELHGSNSTINWSSALSNNRSGKASIASSVTVKDHSNSATARIGKGAIVDASSVTVDADAHINAFDSVGIRPTNLIFGTGGTALGGVAIGAAYTNMAKAFVDDAAVIRTHDTGAVDPDGQPLKHDLTVSSDAQVYAVNYGLAAARSEKAAIDGNVLVTTIDNDSYAYMSDTASVDSAGDIDIQAQNKSMAASSGGVFSMSGSSSVGATVAYNYINSDTKAFIGDTRLADVRGSYYDAESGVWKNADGESIVFSGTRREPASGSRISADDLNVGAYSAQAAVSVIAAGAVPNTGSGGSGGSSFTLEGSVGINTINEKASAFIDGYSSDTDAGKKIDVDGDVNVVTIDNVKSMAIGGGFAIMKSNALAGAVSNNNVSRRVGSYIIDSNVASGGKVGVNAYAESLLTGIAAGLDAGSGQSGSTLSFAGSATANVLTERVTAAVTDDSVVVVDGDDVYDLCKDGGCSSGDADTLTVRAHGAQTILGVDGAFNVSMSSGSKAGVGAAVDVADIDTAYKAFIRGSDVVNNSGDSFVSAELEQDVYGITASLAAQSATFTASGSSNDYDIDNVVEAWVDNTDLDLEGTLSINAVSDSDGLYFGGAGAVAKTFGLGLSNILLMKEENVRAFLGRSKTDSLISTGGLAVNAGSDSDDVAFTFTLGIASSGAGAAITAPVAIIAENVNASIADDVKLATKGRNASIDTNDDGVPDTNVVIPAYAGVTAQNDLSLASVGLVAAAGSRAGIGIVAGVADIDKHTSASVGKRAQVTVEDGDFSAVAKGTDRIFQLDVGVAGGGTAGVTGSAGAIDITETTTAFVDEYTDVTADGNIVIDALTEADITNIVGGVAIGGTAGVGASVGVITADFDTDAYAADRTKLETTGEFVGGYAQTYNGITEKTVSRSADEALRPSSGYSYDSDKVDYGRKREVDFNKKEVLGIVLNSASRINTQQYTAMGGIAGTVAVTPADQTTVIYNTTRARTGLLSSLNAPRNGASDVYLNALSDLQHTGVVGQFSGSGTVSVGPAVNVFYGRNTTRALVGEQADVYGRDVVVNAGSSGNILAVAAGASVSGNVAVAGSASAVDLENETEAGFGYAADVVAEDDATIKAVDNTSSSVIAGALAAGIGVTGIAAAVAVNKIKKTTTARSGQSEIDALDRNNDGINGLQIIADSSENLKTIALGAGGGLYAGIAGSVGVTLLDSDTYAFVEDAARINADAAYSDYSTQDVVVSASNRVDMLTTADALAVGLAGIGAGIDIGIINNDTDAYIGTAEYPTVSTVVNARRDIKVNATSQRSGESYAMSAAGGAVGVNASLSIYKVNTHLNDDGTLGPKSDEYEFSDEEAGGEQDTNNNASVSTADVDGLVQAQFADNDTIDIDVGFAGNAGKTESLGGTNAYIGARADIHAGRDLYVEADETNDFDLTAGGMAAGCVAVGVGVAVLDVESNSRAFIADRFDGDYLGDYNLLTAANADISARKVYLDAYAKNDLSARAYNGAASYAGGLTVSVASVNVDNNTQAYLGEKSEVYATNGVSVKAASDTAAESDVLNVGLSYSGVSIGVAVANSDVTGATTAKIGDNALIKSPNSTSGVEVDADSRSVADADAVAGSGGLVGAGVGAGARAQVSDTTESSIGEFVEVGANKVSVTADALPAARSLAAGGAAGLGLAAGASVAISKTSANVGAFVGEGSLISANSLTVHAGKNTPADGESKAHAIAGSGAALVAVNAVYASSTTEGATRAVVGADLGAGASSADTVLNVAAIDINTEAYTDQKVNADAVSVSGLAAAGVAVGDGDVNTVNEAALRGRVLVTGDSFELHAWNKDESSVETRTGAFAGGVAVNGGGVEHDINTDVKAVISADSVIHAASSFKAAAENESFYYSGLAGAAIAGLASVAISGVVNTINARVKTDIGRAVNIASRNIDITAQNKVDNGMTKDSGHNVKFATGGLFGSVNGSWSKTDITTDTDIAIGNDVAITQLGNQSDPGLFSITGHNTVNSVEKTKLSTGSMVAGAYTLTEIDAHDSIDLTIGAGARLRSLGDMTLSAGTDTDIYAISETNLWGLVGIAADPAANAYLTSNKTIDIAADALLYSKGNLNLYTSFDGSSRNELRVYSKNEIYNKTAVPIGEPMVDAIVNENNLIRTAAGSRLLAVGDLNFLAYDAYTFTRGVGLAYDWVHNDEFDEDMTTDYTNISGFIDTNREVRIDGEAVAGYQNEQVITIRPVYDASGNPVKFNQEIDGKLYEYYKVEVIKTVKDEDGNLFDVVLGEGVENDGAVYNLKYVDMYQRLVDYYNELEQKKADAYRNPVAVAGYQMEQNRVKNQLTELEMIGSDGKPRKDKKMQFVELGDIKASVGDIRFISELVTGSGSLKATADAKVQIKNLTPSHLELNDIVIPSEDGGRIFFNLSEMKSSADFTDPGAAFSSVVSSSSVFGDRLIDVQSISSSAFSSELPSDIYVSGKIHNLKGTISLSTDGSVIVQPKVEENASADQKYAMSLLAQTIKIDAGRNFVLNQPGTFSLTAPESTRYIKENSPNSDSDDQVVSTGYTDSKIIVGNNVYIAADVININGLIQSGIADSTLQIPSGVKAYYATTNGTDIYLTLAEIRALYSSGKDVKRYYPLQLGDNSNISAEYDAKENRIVLSNVYAEGGYMELVGHVMNTNYQGGGKLRVLDGYARVNIDNQSGYDLMLNTIDVSRAVEGKIRITDGAFTKTEDGINYAKVTEYTRAGTDTAVDSYYLGYNAAGDKIVQDIDDSATPASQYLPLANQYYVWHLEKQRDHQINVTYHKETSNVLFWDDVDWAAKDPGERTSGPTIVGASDWELSNSGNFYYTSSPSSNLPGGGYTRTITQIVPDGSYSYSIKDTGYTNAKFIGAETEYELEKRYWKGCDWCAADHHHYYTTNKYEIKKQYVYNFYENASYPVGIEFFGYETPDVTVKSDSDVYINGNIRGGIGSINFGTEGNNLGKNLYMNNPLVDVSAKTINFNVDGNIGTQQQAVRVDTWDNPLNITTKAGDVHLFEVNGPLYLGNVSTVDGDRRGNVAIEAIGDIIGTGKVSGKDLVFVSDRGSVASADQRLVIDATGDVSVEAMDSVYLQSDGEVLRAKRIAGGNVVDVTAQGNVIDANKAEYVDERKEEELRAVWDGLGITDAASDRYGDDILAEKSSLAKSDYDTYWGYRSGQSDTSEYDPDFQYEYSDDAKNYFKNRFGWDDTKIASEAAKRTQEYHTLQTEYGDLFGSSYDTGWNYVDALKDANGGVLPETVLAESYGGRWDEDDFNKRLPAALFDDSLGTSKIEDPNFAGKHVTVKATGGFGATNDTMHIVFDEEYTGLTSEQLQALAEAERDDVTFYRNDAGKVTAVDVVRHDDIDIELNDSAQGSLTVEAAGDVYLGSEKDVNIDSIRSGQKVIVKVDKGLYSVSVTEGTPERTNVEASDVILESATDQIGREDNPLRIRLLGDEGTVTARALKSLYLRFIDDARLAELVSVSGGINVYGTGSLYDANGDEHNFYGESLLISIAGDAGTAVNALEADMKGERLVRGNAAALYLHGMTDLLMGDFRALSDVDISSLGTIRLLSAGGGVSSRNRGISVTARNSILDADEDAGTSFTAREVSLLALNGTIGTLEDALELDVTGNGLTAQAEGIVHAVDTDADLRVQRVVSLSDDVILDAADGTMYIETAAAAGDVTLAARRHIIGTGTGTNVTGNAAYLTARNGRIDVVTSVDTATLNAVTGIDVEEVDGIRVTTARNTGTGDVAILAHAGNIAIDLLEQNTGNVTAAANAGSLTNTRSIVNSGNVSFTAASAIVNQFLQTLNGAVAFIAGSSIRSTRIDGGIGNILLDAGTWIVSRLIESDSGDTTLHARGGNVTFDTVNVNGGNAFVISDTSDVNAGLLQASDTATVTAAGSVYDKDADTEADIAAGIVTIDARGGTVGTADEYLETISGTLNARADSGIFIRELSGRGDDDMNLGLIETARGRISLLAVDGSIIDGNGAVANILGGDYLHLRAAGGIDTDMISAGLLDAEAVADIEIDALAGDMNVLRVFSGMEDVRLCAFNDLINASGQDEIAVVTARDALFQTVNGRIATAGTYMSVALSGDLSADAEGDVHVVEVESDMDVGTVTSRSGDVWLDARAGSMNLGVVNARQGLADLRVRDSINDRDDDDEAGDYNNINSTDLNLYAERGHIGTKGNYIEIDTSLSRQGEVTARAYDDIFLYETSGDFVLGLRPNKAPGIFSVAGDIGLKAERSIWDTDFSDDYVNIWGRHIWLRAINGQVGFRDNLIVADSHPRFSVRAKRGLYIEERNGNMYSDYLWVDDDDGFLYLHIADADGTGGHGIVDSMYCMGDIDVDLHGINNLWVGEYKKDKEFLPWEDRPESAVSPARIAETMTGRKPVFSGPGMPMNIGDLFRQTGPLIHTMGTVHGLMLTAPVFFYHGMDTDLMNFYRSLDEDDEEQVTQ